MKEESVPGVGTRKSRNFSHCLLNLAIEMSDSIMVSFITTTWTVPARRLSSRRENTTRRRMLWTSELVAVAGATGGVGRLVIDRLLAIQKVPEDKERVLNEKKSSLPVTGVRAIVRNTKRASKVLPVDNNALSVYQLGSHSDVPKDRQDNDEVAITSDLQTALKGVGALVICTGTTAFPTRAWRGGNTPRAVDDVFVRRLVSSVDAAAIRRVVLASSVGTGRARKFPFIILNAFGVLDCKRRGEEHVRDAARTNGYAYSIVRAGRLVGEPQTNIGVVRSKPNPNWLDIKVASGDTFIGDLTRGAAADAIVFATTWDLNANLDFSIVHALGCSPPIAEWEALLQQVEVPKA